MAVSDEIVDRIKEEEGDEEEEEEFPADPATIAGRFVVVGGGGGGSAAAANEKDQMYVRLFLSGNLCSFIVYDFSDNNEKYEKIPCPALMKIPAGYNQQCDHCKTIQMKVMSTRYPNGYHFMPYVNCYHDFWKNNKLAEKMLKKN